MECAEWRRALRGWLETGRSVPTAEEMPPELARHAMECADCSARLSAAGMLLGEQGWPVEPAPWLAGRISARTAERAAEGRPYPRGVPAGRLEFLRRAAAPLAAALLSAVAVFLVMVLAGPARMERDIVIVRLVLEAPQAAQVSVVGDWNGWNGAADRLSDADGDGFWETEIRLHRGREYRYQFLIDGETWVADPRAPLQVEDGFGGASSLLQI